MQERQHRHRRSIRVRIADLPGSLHRLTGLVAECGVNIVRLEVASRDHPDVWDDIELAAESESQLDSAVASLRDDGLTVISLPQSWSIRDWAVEILHALEHLGDAVVPKVAVSRFAATAATLANVDHAFVLLEPSGPDAAAAEARWELVQGAASAFDPDEIRWSGDAVGVRIVTSALHTARAEGAQRTTREAVVGAVVGIPIMTRRPAYLVVVGRRPPLLAPELARLKLFAEVAGAHLWAVQARASA